MAVKIGSARIDERGKISGGKAGDQTKNEVGRKSNFIFGLKMKFFKLSIIKKEIWLISEYFWYFWQKFY